MTNRRGFLKMAAAAPLVAPAIAEQAAATNVLGTEVLGAGRGVPAYPMEGIGFDQYGGYSPKLVGFWQRALDMWEAKTRMRREWCYAYRNYRDNRWRKADPRARDARFIFKRFGAHRPNMEPWVESLRRDFTKLPAWAKDPLAVAAFEARVGLKDHGVGGRHQQSAGWNG